ncbi:hypothetical protein DPMN_009415 [Dreissena polymorpha]|uniref:Uncharacterized protein n=1 Tax=Dreissena polymorpha TaxID=45954 RepID=A0A9D4S0K3_DREPO|nr:hypothetical protein DPMN_009415 [Dreissena polymorpha]
MLAKLIYEHKFLNIENQTTRTTSFKVSCISHNPEQPTLLLSATQTKSPDETAIKSIVADSDNIKPSLDETTPTRGRKISNRSTYRAERSSQSSGPYRRQSSKTRATTDETCFVFRTKKIAGESVDHVEGFLLATDDEKHQDKM